MSEMTNRKLREEYPRPQWERDLWLNLNGEWEFEYDDKAAGQKDKWYREHHFSRKIQVPFCYQSELSGIGETEFHDIVWYRKTFDLPNSFQGKRVILNFGAVDYLASVWVNGQLVAYHEGGHTPFSVEITGELQTSGNTIVVRAQDFSKDVTIPRGKQYWEEKSRGIFYTRTTGIWQTVWLEAVSDIYLEKAMFTPDIDNNEIQIRSFLNGLPVDGSLQLKIAVSFNGQEVSEDIFKVKGSEEARTIKLHDFNDHGLGRWWTPDRPNLYDVELTLLSGGQEIDTVKSYFGMRKISVENGKLCLNNRPIFMKMVLDQGYFPEGILTAPSDEDLKHDVELTKAMGFNGARKHQKIEDPRYLYWCDKLGLLVWGEMANAYQFSEAYVRRVTQEWQAAIERDYNHPCIVAWVPLNESWGVPNILIDKRQQQHALTMYHLTKSLDATRPVISNDGWEHVKSDICTIHDYEWRQEVLEKRYSTADGIADRLHGRRFVYVPGYPYNGEPVHVSEFGGISFKKSDQEGWGYSGAENESDFAARLAAVVHPLLKSPIVQGFCYTQLTDVEQEINGLLTYDRKPKLPLDVIKQINQGKLPKLEDLESNQD